MRPSAQLSQQLFVLSPLRPDSPSPGWFVLPGRLSQKRGHLCSCHVCVVVFDLGSQHLPLDAYFSLCPWEKHNKAHTYHVLWDGREKNLLGQKGYAPMCPKAPLAYKESNSLYVRERRN